MRLVKALHLPACDGVDHMDFTADARLALVSCEFAGRMVVVDLRRERMVKRIDLQGGRDAPGRQALARRAHVLRRRHGRQRRVADRCAPHAQGALPAHRPRRPRPVPEPRLEGPLRLQPRGGDDHPDLLPHAPAGAHVADPGRRLTGHGRRVGRRTRACGCQGATTARSTRSPPSPGASCTASTSATARTASASGPSPGATRSGTRASCADGWISRQAGRRTWNSAPEPAPGEVSVTSPPAARARRRASGRPSPAPPWPLTPATRAWARRRGRAHRPRPRGRRRPRSARSHRRARRR